MLWRLARLRKLSVQKFRAEAAGESAAVDGLRDLARLVRRLGRRLRATDLGTITGDDRRHLERLLSQARARLDRAIKALQGRRRHVRPTDRDTAPGASLSLRSAL